MKIDLTGVVYGRLTAVAEAGRCGKGGVLWLCKCQCGGQIIVRSSHLRKGLTRSCGCLQHETRTALANRRRVHRRTVGNWVPGGSVEDLEDLVK